MKSSLRQHLKRSDKRYQTLTTDILMNQSIRTDEMLDADNWHTDVPKHQGLPMKTLDNWHTDEPKHQDRWNA